MLCKHVELTFFIVYAPSIDETVSSFPENRQYFCQNVNTRPHTINNIVKTTDFDNNIDRVRSAILRAIQWYMVSVPEWDFYHT